MGFRPQDFIPFKLDVPPGADFWPFLIVSVLALVLVLLFIFKVYPANEIRGILNEREAAIARAQEQVDQTMRETEEMRNDYRQRLQGIETETQRRLAEAVSEANTLRDSILAEARTSADAIVRRGEEDLARERAKAHITLRQQFVEDVIRAAEYAAGQSLDGGRQQKLVARFVDDISRDGHSNGVKS